MRNADHTVNSVGGGEEKGKATFIQICLLVREYFDTNEEYYYVESPSIDLVEAGRTKDEARDSFMAAFKIIAAGWIEDGILRDRLQSAGFVEDTQFASAGMDCDIVMYNPPEMRSIFEDETRNGEGHRDLTIRTVPFVPDKMTECSV